MTIQDARLQLTRTLDPLYEEREAASVTDWVLEHITGWKKAERLLNKTQLLTGPQLERLQEVVQQLAQHRPVQYVLGEAWFGGMKFYVNEHTLIPRPETEELVDWILTDAANTAVKQLLDIGTGSGCIPITLKKQLPATTVTSIDVSEAALSVAQQNAGALNAAIQLLHIDFLDETQWEALPQAEIIVSNPPYIKYSERGTMSKHVTDFEPGLALFVPDEDALIFYRKIADYGMLHLPAKGKLFLEINESLGKEVIQLLEEKGYSTQLKNDLQGKDRMIKAIKP